MYKLIFVVVAVFLKNNCNMLLQYSKPESKVKVINIIRDCLSSMFCMCAYMYMYVCICIRVYVYVHVYVCVYKYMYICYLRFVYLKHVLCFCPDICNQSIYVCVFVCESVQSYKRFYFLTYHIRSIRFDHSKCGSSLVKMIQR